MTLSDILRIENEQLRLQALVLWMAQLTEEERRELNESTQKIIEVFQPFIEAISETCQQIASAISEWIKDNPELMIYLEPCLKCKQVDIGQTGEYPCSGCGLPMVWDD